MAVIDPGSRAPSEQGTSAARPGVDGFAVASLVSGLLGIPAVGLVLGFVALRRTKAQNRPGRGMAIAGVILSVAWLAIGSVWIGSAWLSGRSDVATSEKQFSSPSEVLAAVASAGVSCPGPRVGPYDQERGMYFWMDSSWQPQDSGSVQVAQCEVEGTQTSQSPLALIASRADVASWVAKHEKNAGGAWLVVSGGTWAYQGAPDTPEVRSALGVG